MINLFHKLYFESCIESVLITDSTLANNIALIPPNHVEATLNNGGWLLHK